MRIGVAGLGTIGGPLAQRLARDPPAGVTLAAICARQKAKHRALGLSRLWVSSLTALARDTQIDTVVELLGGTSRPVLEFVSSSLRHGKHVITANKALLAMHGRALASLAEKHKVGLYYEAAIGGGIPIVKTLRESLYNNDIHSLYGILNGTCNFILSTMQQEHAAFAVALAEAKTLGYAEPDPRFDITGADAAQKLALLCTLAFALPPEAPVPTTGIDVVSLDDTHFASHLGYDIRLIARAQRSGRSILRDVTPMLVAHDHPLAHIKGAQNAIFIAAQPVGTIRLDGAGAGVGPTISAILSDIHDCAQPHRPLPFARPVSRWRKPPPIAQASGHMACAWYLRLWLDDKAGRMAQVSSVLARHKISIREVVQRPILPQAPRSAGHLPVLFITHVCRQSAMQAALKDLRRARLLAKTSLLLPVFAESANDIS